MRGHSGREHLPPSVADLLAAFGADDGAALCLGLLEQAVERRNAGDVEYVLIMALQFEMGRSYLPILRVLARMPWHTRHQDISRYIEDLGGAEVVDDLEFLAWAGPEYQDYEGSTALASKAVHSLERIATPDARAALARLREHPEPDVRELVERVERRMVAESPRSSVWPVLHYDDTNAALRFLVDVVGFTEAVAARDEDGDVIHAELRWPGGGALVFGSTKHTDGVHGGTRAGTNAVYVSTDEVDAVYDRVRVGGGRVVEPPHDTSFGSGTGAYAFTARDLEGNVWTFGTYRGGTAGG